MERINKRHVLWLCAFFGVLVVLAALAAGPAYAGKWKDASKRHEDACNTWCSSNSECTHCSTLKNCGHGYENLRSWDGYGQNWHACKKRLSYSQAGEQNHTECIDWCQGNKPRCVKCSTYAGCGPGYKSIKTFGGRGNNYFACERRSDTADRMNECDEWCSNNKPRCVKCTQKDGCGAGYKTIKSFRGPGINYFACEDRGHSEQNEVDCINWCRDHHVRLGGPNGWCHKCSKTSGCGPGLTAIKSWKGKGKNWYACGNRGYLSEQNKWECYGYCNTHDNCARCMRVAGCGAGYKQLEAFGGKGNNWYACEDRGGSEDNYERCQRYCQYNESCKKCDRSPGCGQGYEHLKTFKGKGRNWYACEEKTYRGGTLTPPE